MERSKLKSGALIDLTFLTDERAQAHAHDDIEMLFVVSGRIVLSVGEKSGEYASGDLVVVNAGQTHSYRSLERPVLARLLISRMCVQELLGVPNVLFWCDSVRDENEAYEGLRRVIGQILNQVMCETTENRLFLTSLYYQMLHILTENFALRPGDMRMSVEEKGPDDRMEQIRAFIRDHYRESISLADLSELLYLSPTYVSKYIKSHCGIGFLQLLNSVRLGYAVEDLVYTTDPVTKIAMENGFASVAAFNKAFKEAYDQTPTEFRCEHAGDHADAAHDKGRKESTVRESVKGYLEKAPQVLQRAVSSRVDLALDLRADASLRWDYAAVKVVNAGSASDLLNAKVQEQIVSARKSFNFDYVRFCGLFDPQICLDIHLGAESQNFGRLDEITDFLVQHRLKPHIELMFKSKHTIRSMSGADSAKGFAGVFSSEPEMRAFYSGLFRHFIRRYGSYEVSSWAFECWERPASDSGSSVTLQYALLTESAHRRYFAEFSIIAEELRKLLPISCIGGAGFPARVYGEQELSRIFSIWNEFDQTPDFVSLTCYPYQQEKVGQAYFEKRTSDLGFVRYGINLAKAAMVRAGFPEVPVRVMEYNLTLCARNALNDSCLKAAYLVANAIACVGETDVLGYALLSDYSDEGSDTSTVLFGGGGLVTSNGIRKPAFGALSFINLLYPDVQARHRNCLVTRNARGSMRIVCHNLKKPNYNYYRLEEEDVGAEALTAIQSDSEMLSISLSVAGVEDGEYQVKTRLINRHHGSVQDKWVDMGMEPGLVPEEMEYLRACSLGDIQVRRCEATDGVLELQWEMEPNEIRYVHVYRR